MNVKDVLVEVSRPDRESTEQFESLWKVKVHQTGAYSTGELYREFDSEHRVRAYSPEGAICAVMKILSKLWYDSDPKGDAEGPRAMLPAKIEFRSVEHLSVIHEPPNP